MIKGFQNNALTNLNNPAEQWKAMLGITYSVITFCASLRGNEGLKVNHNILLKYWDKGLAEVNTGPRKGKVPGRVIIPVMGRFKCENGERCHLIALPNETKSGINIRKVVNAFMTVRKN